MQRPRILGLLLLLALASGPAAADEGARPQNARPENGRTDGEATPEAVALYEVTGSRVNVRVGPRLDNHPITHLDRGDLVIVVEQVPGWYGVRIPKGFPVAVSLDYVVPEGPHGLRVMARRLNLRASPPEKGRPAPGVFRDHPALGELLTLIDVEDPEPEDAGEGTEPTSDRPFGNRWAWVMAPEGIRAYVSEKFLRRLEPTKAHLARLEAVREQRRKEAAALVEARRAMAARQSAMRLMKVVGEVQRELFRLRKEGGNDKAPVVALSTRVEEALRVERGAMPAVLRLAHALREDLERETEIRVLRHDVEVAKALGRDAPAVPLPAPKEDGVTKKGVLIYEATPGWREKGVWFLWVGGRPSYVLEPRVDEAKEPVRLGTYADGKEHAAKGSLTGQRLFGLPVLVVEVMDPK